MPATAACPDRQLLREYALGHLPDDASDDLMFHVRTCDPCQHELSAIDPRQDQLIRDLREAEDTPYADEAGCAQALARAMLRVTIDQPEKSSEWMPKDRTLGDYELLEPLGRGGMGTVYRARHTRLDREVAVKVLSGHRLADARSQQRFEREMKAIGKLHHPNIVVAHDAREIDGIPVLVMECIEGLDAGEIARRVGRLAVTDACEITRRVADALRYAELHEMVHRDVKPSNIMLSDDGQVKLLDLGLARLRGGTPGGDSSENTNITHTGQTMGTADYVAPEQVTDSRSADARSDVYSLGCTLYHLLTGQPPYSGDDFPSPFSKMQAHVSQEAPSATSGNAGIPAALEQLLRRMMSKTPERRPSPEEVTRLIEGFCDGYDLGELVAKARSIPEPVVQPASSKSVASTSTPATQPQGWWNRRIPIWKAVAMAGFFGVVLGALCFAIGVTIRIKHPDGTETSVDVPEGSHVSIDGQGNVDVELPGRPNETGSGQDRSTAMPRHSGTLMSAPTSPDQKRLQGLWKIQTPAKWEGSGGQKMDLAFVGNTVTAIIPGQAPECAIAILHESTSPAGMDWHWLTPRGKNESPVSFGIYRLDGDNLTLLLDVNATPDQPPRRPEAFHRDSDEATLNEMLQIECERTGSVEDALEVLATLDFSDPQIQRFFRAAWARSQADFSRNENAASATSGADRSESSFESAAQQLTADLIEMQGLWQATNQTELASYGLRDTRVAIVGDKLSMIALGNPGLVGRVRLDDQTTPRSIDLYASYDGGTQRLVYGIYQQSDDALTLVLNVDSNAIESGQPKRPRSFDTAELTMRLELKRVGTAADATALLQIPQPGPNTVMEISTVPSGTEAQKTQSMKNLFQLGLALHNYHDAYKAFPPAYTQDEEARPLLSWRVQLLPFMNEEELFSRFHHNEPWDSPHNMALIDEMPQLLRLPSAKPGVSTTAYCAVVGNQTVMQAPKDSRTIGSLGVRISDIRDGTSNTLILVESDREIPWTAPQDVQDNFETAAEVPSIGGVYSDGAHVLLADGSAVFLPSPTDRNLLRALITIDGGETVALEKFK